MKDKNQYIDKLDDLELSDYKEMVTKIDKKIGKMPKLPKDLTQGVWTDQSKKVLSERYLKKDEEGRIIETPDELCWRVSWDIAKAEVSWGKGKKEVLKIAKTFYNLLVKHEFLPNSPTLMNAGTGNGLQYSACFVLPVEDSIVGIFDAIKYQAQIHQTGGGTGFSFSRLRSSGSMVKTSKGTASGPVSFMRIFDAATNEIKQGGKRRGANMGILRVDHPDILEFIHCKEEGGITNFNISVAITDKFIKAYEEDGEYELVNPNNKQVAGKLSARKVFDEIAQAAWRTGDPGLIFIDRINKSTSNPVPVLGPVESTNPCGEQPLYPYDSCNLGSIFLNYFVKEEDGLKSVDWEKLKRVARESVRFLDNVIEMNPYPLEPIRRTSLAIRRIGLGVGGWADLLMDLEIPYDSQEALDLGGKIMKIIQDEGVKESEVLAKERGAFPLFRQSIYKDKTPRRNSTVTTIAPTGSISIIAGSSSGIEPIFALAFRHIVKDKHLDRTLTFLNPKFEEIAKREGVWSEEVKNEVLEKGSIRGIKGLPENLKKVFGTAHEIHHDWHIKHQAAFQEFTENAVSKTINMDHEVKVEDIKNAYLLAWKTKCMGITVFRDGCKDEQVLNLGVKEEKKEVEVKPNNNLEVDDGEPMIQRPLMVKGATYRMKTPVGTAFVTINESSQREPMEVFIAVGKAGSDIAAMADALGRTISTALRFKGNLHSLDRAREIASQLAGIGGRRSVGFGPNKILSLPDAVAAAISWHFDFKVNGFLQPEGLFDQLGKVKVEKSGSEELHTNGFSNGHTKDNGFEGVQLPIDEEKYEPAQLQEKLFVRKSDLCPKCGATALVYEEGCSKCHVCGYSEC